METTISDTVDNGVIENVHIAPIGDFNGSDAKGNPIPEHITRESLEKLADKLNAGDDILMDVDHQSTKPGVERDTSAVGWFHKFVVDPIKGLFATLKLTAKGKQIFENREYRYTSPTFLLNQAGEPVDLHSVAATNLPAFKGFISPVLNTESTEIQQKETIEMNMSKEELVELIKEVVLNSCPETKEEVKNEEPEKKEETKEEVKEESKEETKEEVKNEESKEETKEEKTEGEKLVEDLEKKEEVKNEEVPEKKETQEEIKEEKKPEVVSETALNNQPQATLGTIEPEWTSLHGQDFFNWLQKHPEVR